MDTDDTFKVGDLLVDHYGYGIVLEHICGTMWEVRWTDMKHSISYDSKECLNSNGCRNVGQGRRSDQRKI